MKLRMLLVTALVGTSAAALADEKPVALKDAPGHEIVEGNCGSCHSLDYIRINAPFMTAKVWEAEVGKMINAFGAPIEAPDAKVIVDYLSRHYGVAG